jgi:hypothetical protein
MSDEDFAKKINDFTDIRLPRLHLIYLTELKTADAEQFAEYSWILS